MEPSSIPEQQTGSSSDTAATFSARSPEEAAQYFKQVRNRLLDVNHWEKIISIPSADFVLCDEFGRNVNRLVKERDLFRINIPGPGNTSGDGDDWVKVESISERYSPDEDEVVMRVRPTANPKHPEDTAHFFSEDATSSFIIRRNKEMISAEVHGRNEKPNTNAGSLKDKIRNSVVAAAAITAFSKIQWKGLVNGLINK